MNGLNHRRFNLVRHDDHTGLSGTGVVAQGVEFRDGTVTMRWLQDGVSETNKARGVRPTTVIFESVDAVEALHGHNGATTVEWLDRW